MKYFAIVLAIISLIQFCAGDDIPCGKQAPGNEPIDGLNNQQYISGGIHAKPHSWPWAAAILGVDGFEPLEICGGTVIDKRWVLTAGHCAGGVDMAKIKLGADDRGKSTAPNEPSQQVFKVEKYIVNPNFDYDRLAFDMALLKLDRDIEFNDNIRPICLPDASETLAAGELATTIGWGARDDDFTEYKQLQQIKLPVVDVVTCNNTIHANIEDAVSVLESCMVCAGFSDIKNTSGTYAGDSGSALMAFHDDVWKLYGVTSWRYRFGPYMPGVWSYVPKMVDWVKETMHSN